MKRNHLKRLIGFTAMSLLLLGGLAVSAAAAAGTDYTKIDISFQPIRIQRADGSSANAEFLSEIIIFPDGRANGGWGMWEINPHRVLSLYHVFEGRKVGAFYTLKAERLSPLPAEELTFTVRPSQSSVVPTGSVVFKVDGVSSFDGQPITFSAVGEVGDGCVGGRGCADALPQFGFIRAEPQTVVVQSLIGNYTANFEHVTLVLSNDRAIGSLMLSDPADLPLTIRVGTGEANFLNGEAISAWLHGTAPDSPLPMMIRIANEDLPSEPCRIYDIVGPQSLMHLEAQGRITQLTSARAL